MEQQVPFHPAPLLRWERAGTLVAEYVGTRDERGAIVGAGELQIKAVAGTTASSRRGSWPQVVAGDSLPRAVLPPPPRNGVATPAGWHAHGRVLFSRNPLAERAPFIASADTTPLQELLKSPQGAPPLSALVTSFQPWSSAFLIDHFGGTELTFVTRFDDPHFFPIDDKARVIPNCWWCLHPHHPPSLDGVVDEDHMCDICDSKLLLGQAFEYCYECGIELCSRCSAKVRALPRSELRNHDGELIDHEPRNHYTIQVPYNQSAKDCGCARRTKLTLVQPPLCRDKYSIVHSKLTLLQFSDHLRLIISSFNVDEDRQWARFTDSFWLQDFPLNTTTTTSSAGGGCICGNDGDRNPFFEDLVCFVEALGCRAWASKLRSLPLDLSRLDPNLHLIASVPGELPGMPARFRDPLQRIHRCLVRASLTEKALTMSPVFAQVFSLGGAPDRWLQDFAHAMCARLDPTSFCAIFCNATQTFDQAQRLRQRKCVFATHASEDTVSWHSKMMSRYSLQACTKCGKHHGWLYVGSHNLSKASWSSQALWELGVLWLSPPPAAATARCGALDMLSIPRPCSYDKLEVFSWRHRWPLTQFSNEAPVRCATGYCLVMEPHDRDGVKAILNVGKHSLPVIVHRSAWNGDSQFPPVIHAVLHVTVIVRLTPTKPSVERVLRVERVFSCDENMPSQLVTSAPTAKQSTQATYVPPCRRR